MKYLSENLIADKFLNDFARLLLERSDLENTDDYVLTHQIYLNEDGKIQLWFDRKNLDKYNGVGSLLLVEI